MQTAVAPTWLFRTASLSLVYPNGTAALSGLTVDVPRGSVGLVGANGAGKTTLFRLMLGLLFPSAGALEVVGRVVAVDPIGIRSRLGYMPEHDCLPRDQSAADLVATFGELAGLPPRAARQRASDVLDLVGLDEARFRPVGGFSTGMRQRTKLAQALVADPELLLLDEPTAGLDPVGREEMLELVKRLSSFGISVLFATHLLDDVQRVCDHVVMIDGGRLVLSGPIDQLVERTGVVRVEVGGRPDAVDVLAGAIGGRGIATRAVDQHTLDVDTTSLGDEVFDVVRDLVADHGLRLYALSSRHRSLDELFLQEAATR
jgi:ABC-2 type transport system ATP-binding protein